jgi:hypothetical protein
MNDKKNETTSDKDEQPSALGVGHGQPGQAGVLLVDRAPRPGTIEIKGPPGMAVSVGGDERCTKIVLHLGIHEEGGWTP